MKLKFLGFFCLIFPATVFGFYGVSFQYGANQLNLTNSTFRVTETEIDLIHILRTPLFPDVSVGSYFHVPLTGIPYRSITLFSQFTVALNLRYGDQIVNGQIFQYQEPSMNNYNFYLSVASLRLMLDGILNLITFSNQSSLYILAGVGRSWTSVNYEDSAIAGVEGGALSLNTHTQAGFAYEFGLGVYYPFNVCQTIFLEYRYTHLPNMRTASHGTLNNEPAIIRPATFAQNLQTLAVGLNWDL